MASRLVEAARGVDRAADAPTRHPRQRRRSSRRSATARHARRSPIRLRSDGERRVSALDDLRRSSGGVHGGRRGGRRTSHGRASLTLKAPFKALGAISSATPGNSGLDRAWQPCHACRVPGPERSRSTLYVEAIRDTGAQFATAWNASVAMTRAANPTCMQSRATRFKADRKRRAPDTSLQTRSSLTLLTLATFAPAARCDRLASSTCVCIWPASAIFIVFWW